jgi:Tol biopolymer transport system component
VTLSPDGTQIATIRSGELSVTDISSNTTTRVAMDAIQVPAWSGDGRRLAYLSDRAASPGIYLRASNGAGEEELAYLGRGTGKATSLWNWSGDGRFIGATIADRIRVISVMGTPRVLPMDSATGKTNMRLSPRGDFAAYISTEIGSNQAVFIRSFDPNDLNGYTQRQIVTGAVGMIRWRADGQELYYLDRSGVVMAVPITVSPQIRAGAPVALFQVPSGFPLDVSVSDAIADVSADGQRFVFLVPAETNASR